MKKMLFAMSIVGLTAFSLVACVQHKQWHEGSEITPVDHTSTQVYPLPGQPGYQGNPAVFYNNPLHAPANQTYYFAFDSSDMRPNDLQALRIQANYLAMHRRAQVRLEGNTDNRGSREYNIGLGWRRDQSVARLLEQWGVAPEQIQMVSYGKESPVVDENTERAWALNRRVNLVYKVTL